MIQYGPLGYVCVKQREREELFSREILLQTNTIASSFLFFTQPLLCQAGADHSYHPWQEGRDDPSVQEGCGLGRLRNNSLFLLVHFTVVKLMGKPTKKIVFSGPCNGLWG
ncbi:hypothetical protein AVEN_1192-1 [Araneus ventricosus]|uniref:Uncharacterized protein n=1 Tax=Araneus ventricosus TaxID=182803 RepID=A0A4Y2KMW4_ARAVE|nr:hypothetical protein AVEN_1192-1 [Araneus ventricosus]